MSNKLIFQPNDAPAGGWGALHATARALREESAILKGGRSLLSMNQPDGFDCPGCAWPDPKHTSSFEFCENGAKAVAFELTSRRVTRDFFAAHSVSELEQHSDYWLEEQGRLTEPMRYDAVSDRYVPVAWEEAFALIGRELRALESPDQAEFYTSGRTSNEAAFLYQLCVRRFGTNNLPDCSNMCHESSGAALNESIGIGKGCVKLEDFEKADAIFIIGQNPGTNHPRMMTTLEQAKKNGATIVAINPIRETGLISVVNPMPQEYRNPFAYAAKMLFNKGTPLSDLWLPVRINGDMAAMRGIMKAMLAEEERQPGSVFDRAFIEQYTVGFESFFEHLRATAWDDIVEGSGLSRDQMQEATRIAMRCKLIICCWAMGLTQHINAVATIHDVMNVLLLV